MSDKSRSPLLISLSPAKNWTVDDWKNVIVPALDLISSIRSSHFPTIMRMFGLLKENQTNHAQMRNTSEPTQSDVSEIDVPPDCHLSKHVENSASLECLGISSYTSVFTSCNNESV